MPTEQAEPFAEAVALHKAGNAAAAEAAYGAVLRDDPLHADALLMLGTMRLEAGDLENAARLIGEALTIKPQQPLAHNNHGNALRRLGRRKEALAAYDEAIAQMPDFAEAHNNRGNALRSLYRHAEALDAYRRAVTIMPDFARAHYNLGIALQEFQRFGEAMAAFNRATDIDPEFADAWWSKGCVKLVTGDMAGGWPLYEWRWKRDDYLAPHRDFTRPAWRGDSDLTGKTLFVYAEQGFGDTIHFCRYAQLAAACGAKVILEVQPALKNLMQSLPGAAQVIAQGETVPAFDYHCALLSLPHAFATDMRSIPATVPYLTPPADRVAYWAKRLGAKKAPRVGIVWAGNPRQKNDANRSAMLWDFLPLAACGVELISLQKDTPTADRILLAASGQVTDLGSELGDFSDTAGAIANLDLVISVCTSVAHLAGAMGRPVWIVLSRAACWRWLLDRADTPWYPTARLFRQQEMGDWRRVMDEVGRELRGFGGR